MSDISPLVDLPGKTSLHVDGNYLKNLVSEIDPSARIDYGALRNLLVADPVISNFHSIVIYDDNDESKMVIVNDFLAYNGWNVIAQETHWINDRNTGRDRFFSNLEAEFVADTMDTANHVDNLVIVAGSQYYHRMLELLRLRFKRVVLVGAANGRNSDSGLSGKATTHNTLRQLCSRFIELENHFDKILRVGSNN